MRISATSASVRITAPASLADSARTRETEPSPHRGNAAEPTGWGSAAAQRSKTAVDPADHGPKALPKMPRAAITARNNSVSKNSPTKSATAMGAQRKRLKMPALPSRRTPRPAWKRFQKSSGLGLSIAGGVMEVSCVRTSEMDSSDSANAANRKHTSELQSRGHLVCRLLLEKKKRSICDPLHHV